MPLNNEVDILNIHNIDNDIRDSYTRSMIAGEEKESYATNDYLKDQYFIWNDRKLYKVTAPITHGDTFVVGVNIKYVGTLASEIYNLYISSAEGIKDLIGNVEEANASKAYYFGDYIILASDGLLYQVTTNVSMGTAWVVGTNIKFIDNVTTVITAIEQKLHKTQQMIAPVEPTNKASRSYEVGEQFIFQNELVEATVHIEQQQTIAKGTNCKAINNISEQMSELREKISHASASRKFIIIGDSYGYGVRTGPNDKYRGWIDYFVSLLPNQTFYYNYGVDESNTGVAAFTSDNGPGHGFEATLKYILENKLGTTAPEEITDIAVIGGNNHDTVATYAEIKTAVTSFVNYARSHFPNANIKIGCLGVSGQLQCIRSSSYRGIKDGAVDNGVEFLYDLKYLANQFSWDNGAGHLTDEGYDNVNPIVCQCVISGHTHYDFVETIPLTVNTTDVSSDAPLNFRLAIERTEKSYHIWVNDDNKYMGYYLNNVKTFSGGSHEVIAFTPTNQYAKIKLPLISHTMIDHYDTLNKDNQTGLVTFAGKGKMLLSIDQAEHFSVRMTLCYYFAGISPVTNTLIYSWEGMGGIEQQGE